MFVEIFVTKYRGKEKANQKDQIPCRHRTRLQALLSTLLLLVTSISLKKSVTKNGYRLAQNGENRHIYID